MVEPDNTGWFSAERNRNVNHTRTQDSQIQRFTNPPGTVSHDNRRVGDLDILRPHVFVEVDGAEVRCYLDGIVIQRIHGIFLRGRGLPFYYTWLSFQGSNAVRHPLVTQKRMLNSFLYTHDIRQVGKDVL